MTTKQIIPRSSQQQLNEDFKKMYDELNDPEIQAKKRLKANREKQAKEQTEDYGL